MKTSWIYEAVLPTRLRRIWSGVAKLVKGDPSHLGTLQRLLEVPNELRAIQWAPGLGMSEHEMAIRRGQRAGAQPGEGIMAAVR